MLLPEVKKYLRCENDHPLPHLHFCNKDYDIYDNFDEKLKDNNSA